MFKKDLNNKKYALKLLKEYDKKLLKIEKNIDLINNEVNNSFNQNEILNLDNKFNLELKEYEQVKKLKKEIFEIHKIDNESQILFDKKIFIITKKIENKKNELGQKEKDIDKLNKLQERIEKEINELSSNINDAPLYMLYNYEYDVINLNNKIEKLPNLKIDLEKLRIKLESKIELRQKEQLGYHVEQTDIKENTISISDINKVKDILDSDINCKEKQIKKLDSEISNKNILNLIYRLINTIKNISLNGITFNWFKDKSVSKLVGNIFIYNGIVEINNINKKDKIEYIDFKKIEDSLNNVDDLLNKNSEIVLSTFEKIKKLKENMLNDYYSLKETDEFIKLFDTIEKIEKSLYDNNKKILKNK